MNSSRISFQTQCGASPRSTSLVTSSQTSSLEVLGASPRWLTTLEIFSQTTYVISSQTSSLGVLGASPRWLTTYDMISSQTSKAHPSPLCKRRGINSRGGWGLLLTRLSGHIQRLWVIVCGGGCWCGYCGYLVCIFMIWKRSYEVWLVARIIDSPVECN